jgi:hypothetical protein
VNVPNQTQNPDGSWSPAHPLGWQPGYDAEIGGPAIDRRGRRQYAWALWHNGHREVAHGTSRTHLGAALHLVLAKWRDQYRRHRG